MNNGIQKAPPEVNASCNGCQYWRRIYHRGSKEIKACHFALDTGKIRGGTVKGCTQKIVLGGTPA